MSEEILTIDDISFRQPDPDAAHPTEAVYRAMDQARNPVVQTVPEPPQGSSMLIGNQEPVSVGLDEWIREFDGSVEVYRPISARIPEGTIMFEPEQPLEPDPVLEPPFHTLAVEAVVRRKQNQYQAPFDGLMRVSALGLGDQEARRIRFSTIARNSVVVWIDPGDGDKRVIRRVTPIVAEVVGQAEGMQNNSNTLFQHEAPPSFAAAAERGFRQKKKLDWKE